MSPRGREENRSTIFAAIMTISLLARGLLLLAILRLAYVFSSHLECQIKLSSYKYVLFCFLFPCSVFNVAIVFILTFVYQCRHRCRRHSEIWGRMRRTNKRSSITRLQNFTTTYYLQFYTVQRLNFLCQTTLVFTLSYISQISSSSVL